MDAMENEQYVATQSYPQPDTAPSVHGTRPQDQPGADPDAIVTARNAARAVPAVDLELPPRAAMLRPCIDPFDGLGSDEDEEEDWGGEEDQAGVEQGPGTCDGAAAVIHPTGTSQAVPAGDSSSPRDPTPSDAAESPPDIDLWDSPEYLAGPELADATTLSIARDQVRAWAAGCGFNVVQKSADQSVGKATFRCSCKGRKYTGGGRNDSLEAGDKRARQTTYALPGESVCPFQ